jgi:glutamyl-tRNA synthetase
MPSKIRVRFAPSPTGSMHVGNVRTAIFNWLFARANHGEFLIRIEDTDPERSRPEWVDVILDGLEWLGLDWDSEPIFQSRRLSIYQEMANRLLHQGIAYRCFCHPKYLEAKRADAQKHGLAYRYEGTCRSLSTDDISTKSGQPYAIRLRSDCGVITYYDGVHGKIEVSGEELDDVVLLRRDGTPTYQFAVVVDDHDMGITHVLRGDDHISNTPKQIQIYIALKWEPPQFSHLPLILGPDKKPLAKRHGSVSLGELRSLGILPEALLNYLTLLGWSPGDDREILSRQELINAFSLKGISPKSAIFDQTKLEWLNGQYLSQLPPEVIYQHLNPFLTNIQPTSQEQWLQAISLLKSRVRLLTDFTTKGQYLFHDPDTFDPAGISKYWKVQETAANLKELIEGLKSIESFEPVAIENAVRSVASRLGISASKLIHPTRLALTGTTVSPGLFELMAHLGRDTVLRRLDTAIQVLG